MQVAYTTRELPPHGRRHYWQDVVSRTYFPLEIKFAGGSISPVASMPGRSVRSPSRATSRTACSTAAASITCATSRRNATRHRPGADRDPLRAGRSRRAVPAGRVPHRAQPPALRIQPPRSGRSLGDEIPSSVLRAHVSRPERLATLQFDASRSIGAVFTEMVRLTHARIGEMDEAARALVGRQLVDLLAMAIESDERVLAGNSSSMRDAHLHRCEHFIRRRLADARLTPAGGRRRCGISLRYLHQIFESAGITVGAYIRNQRLLMCDAMLRDPGLPVEHRRDRLSLGLRRSGPVQPVLPAPIRLHAERRPGRGATLRVIDAR